MSVSVRPTRDAHALSAIARATFLETFAHMIPFSDMRLRAETQDSPEAMAHSLRGGAAAWLARFAETDAPVGFALVCAPDLPEIDLTPTDLELKRIYLLHRFQGRGLGRALLEAARGHAAAAGAERLLLGVYRHNPAVAWYERQGFERVGTRRFRVGTRHFDDLVMALPL